MIQDPNVERVIKNYTEPLQKQISMLQIELEGVKNQLSLCSVVDSKPTFEDINNLKIGETIYVTENYKILKR